MHTSTNYAALFFSETDNDLETLEKNVHDFPASSVARFLLLYHHKKNNNPAFEDLAKQTAIYLNNPYWSEYQLWQIGNQTDSEPKLNEEDLPASANERIVENSSSEITHSNEENKENHFEKTNDEEESPVSVKEEIIEIPPSEIALDHEENQENSLAQIKDEEELPGTVKEEIIEIPSSEIVPDHEENEQNSLAQIKDEEELPASVKEEIIEIPSSELVPHTKENTDGHLDVNGQSKEVENETLSEDEKTIQSENQDISKETELEDKSVLAIKIPDEEINSSKEDLNPDEDEYETVAFEPLHTVDYFASQGIKINEEELANDHLVKQVKSFTAWLKSMKKLHPGQLPEQNEVIEKIIQASSESSNKDANVLTEAMAEVLVKQGKREKAMEMYQKLSLLNPSKSAYFAAKIENLKLV
ncbi:MAG TPA: hypothetical protein VLI68_09165 [Hanamia sp.]|nr:hypothetical protein [Hanamia sp.]